MNTLSNVYNLFHFNLTISPLNLVKTVDRLCSACILFNRLCQTFAESRSMFLSSLVTCDSYDVIGY